MPIIGNLNLSSRSLSSPPSALFEIHLGITPEPLKLAPKETEDELRAGKTKERAETAWFEAVDLTVLKLRDNVIVEIQPEISLFGSLKTLDVRDPPELIPLPHLYDFSCVTTD
jgi:Leucine-rich repeat (LRR) protein